MSIPTTMTNFPAPVGGTPLPADFAPSIVFAVLYGLLLPLIVYRAFSRRSRTALLIGTEIFAIERIVLFSLRAHQSHNEASRVSVGLTSYMQSTLGLGFVGIANDLVNLLRCTLVNPTFGPEMYFQSPSASTKGCLTGPPPSDAPDQPERRTNIRTCTGLLSLAHLASTIPGIIANTSYSSVISNQSKADATFRERYASSALVPLLVAMTGLCTYWGVRNLQRISRLAVRLLLGLILLVAIVAIYRLSVMNHRITSFDDPANPLNTTGAKATFYIFHILPEWIATVILLGFNTRKVFGTGPLGDWRSKDETEKQRKKRLAKEAKKASQRGRPQEDRIARVEAGDDEYVRLREMQEGHGSSRNDANKVDT